MFKAAENAPPPTLVEFLNTLPSPLTTALVGLAPYIAQLRHWAQVVSWRSSWEDSWLALGLLWSVCLLAEFGFRYILPVAILVVLLVARYRTKPNTAPPLVTEDTLQRAISDLSAIYALIPVSNPLAHFGTLVSSVSLTQLLRISAILYIPYLILTYLVRLRVLAALVGTILLTWRARWAALLRHALWRSAFMRWTVYRAWSILSGEPLPAPAISPLSATSVSADASTPTATLRFLFTVYENQRWWMGLDWTAALLPGERPSWCSFTQHPTAPPSIFSLPAPTTVYVLDDKGQRLRRVARWQWAEPEWRVVVHREGSVRTRVERPLPREDAAGGVSASRILRAAAAGKTSRSPERHKEELELRAAGDKEKEKEGYASGESEDDGQEPYTDPDGWIYADNKWEGGSSKGGMGKYTRYRRWTRVAILTETVEAAEPGETGIQRDDVEDQATTADSRHGRAPSLDEKASIKSDGSHEDDDSDQSRLRRRLKAAVRSATLS
ncbi:hypothetical protein CERSUDRAFT_119098 [Gelatoporia subvermispora B]|uniref:Peroxin/Ferlin domain-containing protein n=1 Tax=Ceriporiopsis subvermispora (strain B) TaxID=914234 RepID=M2R1J9_CERS8|nr:hypothetical protein CERSUDRAFT_119098 [Gelatoporia subvermispora B]